MTLKYLITGATGGLGSEMLNYFIANVPRSEFAAASSNPANKATFEDRGIAFRHVNGALRTTHPLLQEILGREPTGPKDFVRKLLEDDMDYLFRY